MTSDLFLNVNRLKPPGSEWDWILNDLVDKELSKDLPTRFRINQLIKYRLKEQERYLMQGKNVYRHLKDSNQLKWCATLHDGVAIQKNIHPDEFRLLWGDNNLVLWGSVFLMPDSEPGAPAWGEEDDDFADFHVPYVCLDGGNIEIDSYWLGSGFDKRDPALKLELTPE